ncbi:MAG: hypothetical protein K9I69_07560 [Ignavibacteriales bacterium]|nr:hypothetical protein [Ignavibacteriales bacterium]MCF8315042.1 hypothetical protein [Ignavibacteriales bacterium]MCF8435962.1 hypothetical protein [Ignavibacteriales bacterium]
MNEREIIRDFLVQKVGTTTFSDSDSLIQNKLLDSLSVMEFVSFLEEQFEISFESDDMVPENLDSIDSVINLLISKNALVEVD